MRDRRQSNFIYFRYLLGWAILVVLIINLTVLIGMQKEVKALAGQVNSIQLMVSRYDLLKPRITQKSPNFKLIPKMHK